MASTDISRSGRGTGLAQRLSTETKASFKTTELYVYLAVVIGVLIAGNSIEGKEGGADYFAGDKVWLYISLLTIGYMVSRGLAKSGSRDPYWSDSGQNYARDEQRDRSERTGVDR